MLILFYLLAAVAGENRGLPPGRSTFTPRQLTACAVATRADVEDAVVRSVGEGSEEIDGPSSTCDYAGGRGLVSVVLQRLAAKPDVEREIAAMRKAIPEGIVRAASGFPGAFYFDIPEAGTQLHVIAGSGHLMVAVLGFGEAPQVSDAAARIARKALRRLPLD